MNRTVAQIPVRYQRVNEMAIRPERQTEGAAAYDAYACMLESAETGRMIKIHRKGMEEIHEERYDREHGLRINPGERALIPLGIRMAFPRGYVCDIRPRSGLALRNGITITNAPGTGDSDYRNEYGAIIENSSHMPFVVKHGDRICQLLFHEHVDADWKEGPLDETDRDGGFGSTGV